MPIYQYQCTACGHELEALQKMSDPRLTDCPKCNNATLKKQLTAAAFKLKGTGWYETDFKNASKKPADTNAKEGSNSSESAVTKGSGSATEPSKSTTASEAN